MSDDDKKSLGRDLDRLGTLLKRIATVGALLAILCHYVPPRYKVVCDKVMHVCTIGVK